jgi:hypothetical protein
MPVHDRCNLAATQHAYFDSLEELDVWAANSPEDLGGVLKYHERSVLSNSTGPSHGGKLLVSTIMSYSSQSQPF